MRRGRHGCIRIGARCVTAIDAAAVGKGRLCQARDDRERRQPCRPRPVKSRKNTPAREPANQTRVHCDREFNRRVPEAARRENRLG
jgi:hypothetical protein